jgi:peptide/nickel transport system permease protein
MTIFDASGWTREEATSARPHRLWTAARHSGSFWIGGGIIVGLVTLAVLAPFLSPHDPNAANLLGGLTDQGNPLGPTAEYPLGTDRLGRDYLSRLLFGARTSLVVGVGANALATLIGVFVGAVAGFFGNRAIRLRLRGKYVLTIPIPIESLLMRAADVVLSFPALLLAIALVAVFGASLVLVTVVIALLMWTGVARIVYGRVLIVRQREFVDAAQALGAPQRDVFFQHVLPHVQSIIIVYATLGVSRTVLFEAGLSFLGVGVPPPAASWGAMISDAAGYYATDPRLLLLPGGAIVATVLGFSLLGDALRDAVDASS